jgi:hypothetical protein
MDEPEPDFAADLGEMAIAEKALRRPIHLPPKARFTKGPAIHV